jgi:hypothetical protein
VTFSFDDQPAGNVYAKTRGTNYSVAGPFSNVANTVYAPQQITNAIGNNTSVLNSSGATLSLLLAIPSLIKALDTVMNGNSNLYNSVQTSTPITASYRVDPLNNGGNGLPPYSGGTNPYVTTANLSFTVPVTGSYHVSMDGNFGNTTANIGATTAKRIDIAVVAGSTHGVGNVVISAGTSTVSDMFDDLHTEFIGNLTSGTPYHLEMSYQANIGDFAVFTSQVTSAGTNVWTNY